MAGKDTKVVFIEFIFWLIAITVVKAVLLLCVIVFTSIPAEGIHDKLLLRKMFDGNIGNALIITLLNRLWHIIKARYNNQRLE